MQKIKMINKKMKLFRNKTRENRSLFLGYIVILITILICFLFLEIGFRIYYFVSYRGSIKDAYEHYENPEKGKMAMLGEMIRPSPYKNIVFEFKPFLDVYFMERSVKTNSLGWRDKEFIKEKSQNTVRIVGIGDSYMWGWAVDENERYMDILETKLNENFPEINWETLVFAIPGYNLKMEIEVLKEYALDYNPDIIIYGYTGNDHCLPNFLLEKKKFFAKELFILDFLQKRIEYAILYESNFNEEPFWQICEQEKAPEQYKEFVGDDSYYQSFKELTDIGKAEKLPIILLSHVESQFNPINPYISYENINYFDPIKEYQEHLKENERLSLIISDGDFHPSVIGHELLGQAIYNQLISNGLVKDLMLK